MAKKADVVSVSQVADALGWRHTKVLRMIKKGQIRAQKVGWFWVVPTTEVTRLHNLNQLAAN